MSLIEREKLLRLAALTTRLNDFGNDDFLEPLDLLLEGYRTTANLNLKGSLAAQVYLHRMLCNRLRLNDYLNKYPTVSRLPIESPIFILGLPRTGSTMLHEVLACHPDLRAPIFWEATFVPGLSILDRCRQLITSLQISAVNLLSPRFKSVHKLGTFSPHECITLQALSLRTMQFHAAHDVSHYNAWLETCDWQPAYDMHRSYLQWLQFNGAGERWVLKAPGHLLSIEALNNTYPNATFIQLHRNPKEVIPSMASLFLHLRAPFTRSVDRKQIGDDVARQWQLALNSTMRQRQSDKALDSRFLDLRYSELTENPIENLSRILNFCGLRNDDSIIDAFQNYLDQHPKGKHGTHRYSLEQFGLSDNVLGYLFADYNRQYAF